jgi:23S rRNA (guanosine2251-2'-O)-methyltransferase
MVFGKNTIVSYLERMDEEEEPGEQTQEIIKIFLSEGGVVDERVRKIKHLAGKLGIPVVNCHIAKLDSMVSAGGRHQGVVAQVSPIKLLEFADWLERLEQDKSEIERAGKGLDGYMIVVLDGIEDPRNVGAIIRSAEAQGARAILIPERRAAQVTDTVAKTSAGAIAHIPIVRIVNTVRALEELKEQGFWVLGLAAEARDPIYRIDLKRPLVIVVGSEGKGLRPLVVSTCDLLGSIPLGGKTESLNASVALGIAVYEAVRQNAANI